MSDHACGSCSGQDCKGQSEEEQALQRNLARIKNKVVVLSGKGGVGKSTVSTNLAQALAMAGMKTGLLDVDVHGPSIPRLLSLSGERPRVDADHLEPVNAGPNLWVMSLGFLLPSNRDAVIWRGPVKMGMIKQFLRDVTWGDLDFLVVDCPPGTGDEPLSVLQLLGPEAKAVIVTTPQGVAIDDVRRSISFCADVGNQVLGVVENMSGHICSKCGQVDDIFGSGGGEALAVEMGVPFLGRIPLDPEVVRSGDEGFAFLRVHHDGPTAQAMNKIVKPILALAGTLQEKKPQPMQAAPAAPVGAAGTNGLLTVAVPVAQGVLCAHFGHCEQFALVTVNTADKTIQETKFLTPPPHEPGVLPKWLSEQGAHLILAGGMGSRAQSLFTQYGIQVLVGAPSQTPEELVKSYLEGNLITGSNICDH
ncbi:MAG TPA: chromosome partitioning protein ParA [Desulfonatronum sp.]|nr:chromosome partitioning protein ParA [Desulfonatronum sp.]